MSAGIPDVEIQPVNALLSNPVHSSLELVDTVSGDTLFTAALAEDVLDLDTTSDTWYRNHTYNGCVCMRGFFPRWSTGNERILFQLWERHVQQCISMP